MQKTVDLEKSFSGENEKLNLKKNKGEEIEVGSTSTTFKKCALKQNTKKQPSSLVKK